MQTIWVIEDNTSARSIAVELMGDFAVRRIASLASLMKISKLQKQVRPDILLIANESGFDRYGQDIVAVFKGVRLVRITDDDVRTPGQAFEMLPPDLCPFSLLRVLQNKAMPLPNRQGATHQYRDVELDVVAQKVTAHSTGEAISVTRKEALVLKAFFARPGACIGRDVLMRDVWGGVRVTDRSIDAQICRLRKLLGDFGLSITSVYGQGYVLE